MNKEEIIKGKKTPLIPALVFCFLTIAVLATGIYIFVSQRIDLEDYSKKQLLNIADLKISQITAWRRERIFDAELICNNAPLINDVKSYSKNKADKKAYERINLYLKCLNTSSYYEAYLTDDKLDVLFSIKKKDRALSEKSKSFIREALKQKKYLISDIHRYAETKELHFDLAAPLLENDKIIGCVLLRINPNKYFFPAVQIWPVKSWSSEVFIVERQGNDIVFLNELKYKRNTDVKLNIYSADTNILAVKGLKGFEGAIEGTDYRGENVLGAIKKIPNSDWIIITKMDRAEIYSSIYRKAYVVILFVLIIILSSGWIILLSWKNHNELQYSKLLKAELQKKETEKHLQESELKFKMLFDSMSEGVALHEIIKNEKGVPIDYKIIDINHSYKDQTGILDENVKGVLATKLYNMNPPPYLELYAEVAKNGKPQEFETYYEPLDRYFKISVTSPGSDLFATIFTNISDRKKYEEEMKATNLKLEQSNKELEQFAYVASHDLQEPLRMVSSFTQLLSKKYKGQLSEEADSYINFAVNGASRMQILINDLLEYSRVTRKGKPLELTESSTAVNQAILNLKRKIEDGQVVVNYSDLPKVLADETQLTRLIQNLIDNAIKYKSDEIPQIDIKAEETDNEWKFSVSDNGIGIDMEYREKIFEIFERLHSISKYPGTGIGLSICKKIVERHGGKIWIENNKTKGVTFYFTLNKKGQNSEN
jgi:signal transduction histidine kinase